MSLHRNRHFCAHGPSHRRVVWSSVLSDNVRSMHKPWRQFVSTYVRKMMGDEANCLDASPCGEACFSLRLASAADDASLFHSMSHIVLYIPCSRSSRGRPACQQSLQQHVFGIMPACACGAFRNWAIDSCTSARTCMLGHDCRSHSLPRSSSLCKPSVGPVGPSCRRIPRGTLALFVVACHYPRRFVPGPEASQRAASHRSLSDCKAVRASPPCQPSFCKYPCAIRRSTSPCRT